MSRAACLLLLLFAQSGLARAQGALSPVWERDFPSGALRALALAPDDRALIGDGQAGAIRTYDAHGAPLWSAVVAPVSTLAVAWSSTGEAIASFNRPNSQTYEVARFSANGAPLGQSTYGVDGSNMSAVAAHPQGGYVVAGITWSATYGGAPAPGSGSLSGFITRHDAQGVELWVHRFDAPGRTVTMSDVAVLPNGDVVGVGFSLDPTAAFSNRVRFRVDAAGQNALVNQIGFGSYQTIDAAANGDYVATAWVPNAMGICGGLIETYSAAGVLRSTICIPGAFFNDSTVHAATLHPSGGVYAWVVDTSPTNVGNPAFNGLVAFDAGGTKLWERAQVHSAARSRLGRHGDLYVATAGPARLQRLSEGTLGAQLCVGSPNSTGAAALTRLAGSATASENSLVLYSASLPPGQSVLYLVANGAASVPNPGGSQGTLCLGGAISRYNQPSQVAVASPSGIAHLGVDLAALPGPTGPVAALAGQTWNFQAWYRDANPGPTSNFTSAVSVLLQ